MAETTAASQRTAMRLRTLRAVGIALSVGSVLLMGSVLVLVVRSEMAHDDAGCPFRAVESRTLGTSVRVTDERRRCMSSVEEHRWVVHRNGAAGKEIGRRRLDAAYYASSRYRWTASTEEGGKVIVKVENRGARPARLLLRSRRCALHLQARPGRC